MTMPCPNADGSSQRTTQFDAEPPMCIDVNNRYTATIDTSEGTMVVALDALKAPRTVNSFVFLARYHYYDGLTFHRIIPGFVLQGGCPIGTGTSTTSYPKPVATASGRSPWPMQARTPMAVSSLSSLVAMAPVCPRSTPTSVK